MTPWIETERLVLTWPTDDQVRAYTSEIEGTDLFDTIVWDGLTHPDELVDGWQRRRSRSGLDDPLKVAAIDPVTDRYLGDVSLSPTDGERRILELGYAFAPANQGRGYATEAVRAVVDHAFAERGAERVFAPIFVGNHASRRVSEKVGLRYEATMRRRICKRGTWIDEWVLAITRPDWEGGRLRSDVGP